MFDQGHGEVSTGTLSHRHSSAAEYTLTWCETRYGNTNI